MAIAVTITTDQTAAMLANIESLTQHELLVGIPADKVARQDSTQPTNAQLAYWHEHGIPSRNLPARPFMAPGIRKAQPQIQRVLEEGARSTLRGQSNGAMQALHRAGTLARNAMVNEITDPSPPFAPLSPRTIRARLARTQGGRRKLNKMLAMGKSMGVSSNKVLTGYQQGNWETGGAGLNMRPLIDTGQLRASLTYVVRPRPGATPGGGQPGKLPNWIQRTLTTIGGWFKRK